MIVPIALLLMVLLLAGISALFKAKRRVIDHEPPPPDIRPNDRLPTAHPDLTNPPIRQPELDASPWREPDRRV